ncbi:hypothetical protein B4135_0185 [Caldibacillus debilis]|uniref:Uncharacterized protein n=1 Tax=Caldibacillus debilis TaxID=301148 RepID=A0A150LWI4_9BACI|nr:hypothetical protein B4135_0185 [Caldibacillus debilis]
MPISNFSHSIPSHLLPFPVGKFPIIHDKLYPPLGISIKPEREKTKKSKALSIISDTPVRAPVHRRENIVAFYKEMITGGRKTLESRRIFCAAVSAGSAGISFPDAIAGFFRSTNPPVPSSVFGYSGLPFVPVRKLP